MQRLNRSTISTHTYPVRIVQFGEGNFLRCFFDWMVHQMNNRGDYNTGVAVVQPIPAGMIKALNEQDGLYTTRLKGLQDGESKITHEVIDAISLAVDPYVDYDQYIALASGPDLKLLVSNTTEAGIAYAEGQNRDDQPPSSYPAKVAQFLFARYQHFDGAEDKGLVLMPCELIDRNGDKLKEIIMRHAEEWGLPGGFTKWLDTSCVFCNTLVDRIVPGYPRDEAAEICKELGYDDKLIVEGELFHLLAVETAGDAESVFPARSAGLNVVFTDNLKRYRDRKVRILNGAHIVMVPLGLLMGLQTVKESVDDPVLGKLVRDFLNREVVPAMQDSTDELTDYVDKIIERFENPYIRHNLSSIALNAVSKFGTRVAPTILDHLEFSGKLPDRAVLAMAALVRFYGGKTILNMPVRDNDEVLNMMSDTWGEVWAYDISIAQLVDKVLARRELWGVDLAAIPMLADAVTKDLKALQEDPKAALLDRISNLNAEYD